MLLMQIAVLRIVCKELGLVDVMCIVRLLSEDTDKKKKLDYQFYIRVCLVHMPYKYVLHIYFIWNFSSVASITDENSVWLLGDHNQFYTIKVDAREARCVSVTIQALSDGRAMAQAVSRRPLTAEARVQSRPCHGSGG
jgi:hypothetical protein